MRRPSRRAALSAPLLLLAACSVQPAPGGGDSPPETQAVTDDPEIDPESVPDATPDAAPEGEAPAAGREVATLGAGCFWCIEAVLEQIDGVLDVRSGYMGGEVEDPSYRAVCTGETGHAEVVEVTFDPARLSYGELLDWFWRLHDPTTLNRQGNDVGTQYRSAIFTHSEAQRAAAEASLKAAQAHFLQPIVTEITPAGTFWEAEPYHQDYYRQNKQQGYCRVVIRPKLEKLGLQR